jgi:hypothetical protein
VCPLDKVSLYLNGICIFRCDCFGQIYDLLELHFGAEVQGFLVAGAEFWISGSPASKGMIIDAVAFQLAGDGCAVGNGAQYLVSYVSS